MCNTLECIFLLPGPFMMTKISGVETSVLNDDIPKILILLSKQAVKALNIYVWVFKNERSIEFRCFVALEICIL